MAARKNTAFTSLVVKEHEHVKKPCVILGVDPGTLVTGYGLIRLGQHWEVLDYGCVRPPAKQDLAVRYRIIFESISALMKKFQPVACSIETQFVGKNVQSAIKLGMARGVIVLAASLQQIPVFEYAPTKAKRAVMGRGHASKLQVQKMIQHLLGLSLLPEPEDAADALALAICHGHQMKIQLSRI
ncbi:MAG: crossover junction endodeoxyribonuclease RuvC [Verrucomicrobia bacterium]|nr:crossover junction endodeoxyribonuclease RuvC [Verrucomicrobiota bacterium]